MCFVRALVHPESNFDDVVDGPAHGYVREIIVPGYRLVAKVALWLGVIGCWW